MSARETREGFRALLDAWNPPPGAGEPVACLATTFTFSPSLFEEQCLPRFAGIEADPVEDGSLYLIEREEKLAGIKCGVLVDAMHCRGRRSLRWDLLLARVPSGVQHAKVSLLCWKDHVRVILASANLTETAYRENQEVFTIIDLHDGAEVPFADPIGELGTLWTFLRSMLALVPGASTDPAKVRWQSTLDWAERRCAEFTLNSSQSSGYLRFVFNVPKMIRLMGALEPRLIVLGVIDSAVVVSPFFDPPTGGKDAAATWLWSVLRQRGDARVEYRVAQLWSEEQGEQIALQATSDLVRSMPERRAGCDTIFARVPTVDVETSNGKRARGLHAKQILFEGARGTAVFSGSSNFTSAGLGISVKGGNVEANVLWEPPSTRAGRRAVLSADRLREGTYRLADVNLKDPELEDAGFETLPEAFQAAVLRRGESGIELVLGIAKNAPKGFEIFEEETKNVLFGYREWDASGRPEQVVLAWAARRLASGLEVTFPKCTGRAWWPVNVSDVGVLPPPDELRSLTLDELIEVLTSTRNLREAMRRVLRGRERATRADAGEVAADIDPHKRVDTSGFLLQRARRYAWALNGLATRLRRPVVTQDALDWRISGPIGLSALWGALSKDAADIDECAFLSAELLLEIEYLEPEAQPGCISVEHVTAALKRWVATREPEFKRLVAGASPNMARYCEAVWARSGAGA